MKRPAVRKMAGKLFIKGKRNGISFDIKKVSGRYADRSETIKCFYRGATQFTGHHRSLKCSASKVHSHKPKTAASHHRVLSVRSLMLVLLLFLTGKFMMLHLGYSFFLLLSSCFWLSLRQTPPDSGFPRGQGLSLSP